MNVLGDHHVMKRRTRFIRTLTSTICALQVPVAIACSAPDARVRDTLQQLQLQDTFGAIITADDVYRGRPDPESYLLAAQQLGRPPARCVVIGANTPSPPGSYSQAC